METVFSAKEPFNPGSADPPCNLLHCSLHKTGSVSPTVQRRNGVLCEAALLLASKALNTSARSAASSSLLSATNWARVMPLLGTAESLPAMQHALGGSLLLHRTECCCLICLLRLRCC